MWYEESVSKALMDLFGKGQAGSQGATWGQAAALCMEIKSNIAGTS